MIATLRLFALVFLVALAPCTSVVYAQETPFSTEIVDPVTLSLVPEDASDSQNHPFWVAIQVKVEPHWHAYWKNPGDAGMPLSVSWSLPQGFTVGDVLWPTPTRFDLESAIGYGYENEVVLLAQVTPPKEYAGAPATLAAEVRWVVCDDQTCLPGESRAELTLPGKKGSSSENNAKAALFEQARKNLPKKSDAIVVTRKDNFIEISVPKELAGSNVSKAEFFPEKSMALATNVVPEWESGSATDKYSKLYLPDDGNAPLCQGVVVFHNAEGPVAYDIHAALAPSQLADDISFASHTAGVPDGSGLEQFTSQPSEFEFQGGVLLAIALAFVGGMILNLMPCVLPVISFKVLGFVKLAGQNRLAILNHGLAFCGGVLLSFWTLAGALLLLQSYGKSVGWGFQLQEPMFVMALASFVFIFALSLFGIFEIGTSLIGVFGNSAKADNRSELASSFFSGIMATAVATPCTGPFLGSAVGFAVTLPPLQAMAIFTSIGLGMSLPYLALAAFPSLLRFMPKPGAWMETFKQLMGFMMVATAVWLVWVFGAQMGSFAITLLLAAFFLFSFAGWIYGRWGTPWRSPRVRVAGQCIALLLFAFGAYTAYMSATPWAEAMSGAQVAVASSNSQHIAGEWEEFSPERVAELRKKGVPVFIDFTAKWCLICQANHLVLSGEEVTQDFAARGIVRMKADWTKRDDIIAAELKKLGRNSVPLYVLYSADSTESPQILPQVLTKDNITTALEQIEP